MAEGLASRASRRVAGVGLFPGEFGCRGMSLLSVTLPMPTCKTTRPAWNCRTTLLRASSLQKSCGDLCGTQEEDWEGWTMEVWQGGRRVWHLPFDPIEPPNHH